jgi:hypothetical protein
VLKTKKKNKNKAIFRNAKNKKTMHAFKISGVAMSAAAHIRAIERACAANGMWATREAICSRPLATLPLHLRDVLSRDPRNYRCTDFNAILRDVAKYELELVKEDPSLTTVLLTKLHNPRKLFHRDLKFVFVSQFDFETTGVVEKRFAEQGVVAKDVYLMTRDERCYKPLFARIERDHGLPVTYYTDVVDECALASPHARVVGVQSSEGMQYPSRRQFIAAGAERVETP